jgi:hypothetical protein
MAQRDTDLSDRLTLRGGELLGIFTGAQRISELAALAFGQQSR